MIARRHHACHSSAEDRPERTGWAIRIDQTIMHAADIFICACHSYFEYLFLGPVSKRGAPGYLHFAWDSEIE